MHRRDAIATLLAALRIDLKVDAYGALVSARMNPAGHTIGPIMHRREAIATLLATFAVVSDVGGTSTGHHADRHRRARATPIEQVNNPYGLAIGPDRAFYFCDLDNQRVRRLDLRTRKTSTIAGNGQKAYAGDGGKATDASLSMPHEIQFDAAGHLYIAERDSHVIRKVDGRSGRDLDPCRHRSALDSPATMGRRHRRSCGRRTALRSNPEDAAC